MNEELAQKAIRAALTSQWDEAVKINKAILKEDPENLDALNRLARACAELGKINLARRASSKVIKLDPHNKIALRLKDVWESFNTKTKSAGPQFSANAFIEEPGKTKIVSLLHVGGSKVLCDLNAGDVVKLSPHAHRVCVVTTDNKYIGRLPDDLAARLRKLIKYGNTYKVLIKSVKPTNVKIFIKETKRSEKIINLPSFSSDKIDYISFTPPELVHPKDTPAQYEE